VKLHDIKIVTEGPTLRRAKVEIDGKPLLTRSVQINLGMDRVNTVTIEVLAERVDVETVAATNDPPLGPNAADPSMKELLERARTASASLPPLPDPRD
jgi:hypothetical protein